eukprot:10748197-Alexandrium_andersonii.AAC.1
MAGAGRRRHGLRTTGVPTPSPDAMAPCLKRCANCAIAGAQPDAPYPQGTPPGRQPAKSRSRSNHVIPCAGT